MPVPNQRPSRRTDVDVDVQYGEIADTMDTLASWQPEFLGVASARDPFGGVGITVSYWRDEASIAA